MTVTSIKTGVAPKRRKRKLKKKVKIGLIQFCVFTLVTLISYFPVKRKITAILNPAPIGTVSVDRFRDLNATHVKYAKQGGVSPFNTNDEFEKGIGTLIKDDKLVEIKDNRYYRICPLTYSHPYLTPEAKVFLNELGKRFQKKLDEKDLPNYYFQISSLLRTQENQRKLSRTNGNATSNSSHAYGTTFDIPYFTVVKRTLFWKEAEVSDGRASKLLSEAIGELRNEGRCVAVTERNEACFHITVLQ
jgi:hypothetical protein